jgi:hypothetical protein
MSALGQSRTSRHFNSTSAGIAFCIRCAGRTMYQGECGHAANAHERAEQQVIVSVTISPPLTNEQGSTPAKVAPQVRL